MFCWGVGDTGGAGVGRERHGNVIIKTRYPCIKTLKKSNKNRDMKTMLIVLNLDFHLLSFLQQPWGSFGVNCIRAEEMIFIWTR